MVNNCFGLTVAAAAERAKVLHFGFSTDVVVRVFGDGTEKKIVINFPTISIFLKYPIALNINN